MWRCARAAIPRVELLQTGNHSLAKFIIVFWSCCSIGIQACANGYLVMVGVVWFIVADRLRPSGNAQHLACGGADERDAGYGAEESDDDQQPNQPAEPR